MFCSWSGDHRMVAWLSIAPVIIWVKRLHCSVRTRQEKNHLHDCNERWLKIIITRLLIVTHAVVKPYLSATTHFIVNFYLNMWRHIRFNKQHFIGKYIFLYKLLFISPSFLWLSCFSRPTWRLKIETNHLALLLLLLKIVGNARMGENGLHYISPKTPATQYQPIERKKRKATLWKT